jgi:hypothetical protein
MDRNTRLVLVMVSLQSVECVKVGCAINKLGLVVVVENAAIALLLRDTDASHVEAHSLVASQEQLMVVRSVVRARPVIASTETVQAELPGEREPRSMLEVLGNDLCHKLSVVVDDKGPPMG